MRWRPKVWYASLDRSRGQPRFFSYSEPTVRTKSTSASRRIRGPGLVSSRPRGLHVGTYGSATWGRKFDRSAVVTTVRPHSGSTVGPIPIAKYPICISVLRDELSGTRRTRLEVHVSQDYRQCGITS